jgi:tyrosine aminotransferase
LSLAIGDPTVFGNLKTPQIAVDAVTEALTTYKANGYTDTEGSMRAREAVAEEYSSEEFKLNGKDVFMANGASGAIWLAIGAVCPRGSNILLPRPGFTYCVAADPMGVECRYYNCLVLSLDPLSRFPFSYAPDAFDS